MRWDQACQSHVALGRTDGRAVNACMETGMSTATGSEVRGPGGVGETCLSSTARYPPAPPILKTKCLPMRGHGYRALTALVSCVSFSNLVGLRDISDGKV